METAEAVQDIRAPERTPLKQGVNQSFINMFFGSPAAIAKKRDASLRQASAPRPCFPRWAADQIVILVPSNFVSDHEPPSL